MIDSTHDSAKVTTETMAWFKPSTWASSSLCV